MKAILQMAHQLIMGSVIDAIEYFLVSHLYDNDVYLVLFQFGYSDINYKKRIINLIKEKYNYNYDFEENIIQVSSRQLFNILFDKVIIVDFITIVHIKGLLRSKNTIIISELTDNKDFILDKEKYSVEYYGEMPFVYKDFQYTMKFAFDFYPKLTKIEEGIYYNYSPKNENNLNIDNYPFIKKFLYSFNKNILLKNRNKHLNNLFEHFDTYVYFKTDYFDTHPRLFIESYFYNKKIIYINENNIKDGSWYRYHDVLTNGLKNRYLDKNDEIIQYLIS